MGDDITELRNRQDSLERRVTDLESTVKTEATARAGMDEDLSKLTITKDMLQKVLDTQSEHQEWLRNLTVKVDNVEVTLGYMDGTMTQFRTEVNDRFTRVEGRLGGVEGRLGGVEGRLDGVEGRLDGVETRLGSVETTLTEVKSGVDAILTRLGPPPTSEN